VLVPATRAQMSPGAAFLQAFLNATKDRPLLLILGLRALEEFFRWLMSRRTFNISRLQVLRQSDEVDLVQIQGCLLSTEQLVSLGRVEKRTLFTKSLMELLSGNRYLVHELHRATTACRIKNRNCLVMRWLPEDAKYQILQACLNEVSSLFGANFVHFNALDGENSKAFKNTWYCLTVLTPTRPERRVQAGSLSPRRQSLSFRDAKDTCTFTDMSRTPRATLRIALVNESELRRIADGKLRPPSWGFFNDRHAERYRMLTDFAQNFQKQLVRTPADSRSIDVRNPFTSEKVHTRSSQPESKPDGGLMKRVQSVPSMGMALGAPNRARSQDLPRQHGMGGSLSRGGDSDVEREMTKDRWEEDEARDAESDAVSEMHCFLRLHVPHYIEKERASRAPLLQLDSSAS